MDSIWVALITGLIGGGGIVKLYAIWTQRDQSSVQRLWERIGELEGRVQQLEREKHQLILENARLSARIIVLENQNRQLLDRIEQLAKETHHASGV